MSDYWHQTVAVCPAKSGRVGLSKRLNTRTFLSYWQFAGGKVEVNEELLDAAQREFFEETGLLLEKSRFEFLGKIEKDPTCDFCAFYYVELNSHEFLRNPEPEKHTDWDFLEPVDALRLKLMPGIKDIIERIYGN